jgi:hypothetical protein
MTWVLLSVLGLLSTGLMYPTQPLDVINTNQQVQQMYQDEFERNYLAEQKQIIIDDYFLFADKIGKINYARWCAWGYEWAGCGKKSYDCWWAMKAYLIAKGIVHRYMWLNSQTLYQLGNPKDARTAERWDFMYRRGFGDDNSSGNMSTHFAVVSRDYDDSWVMWIYDNVNPEGQDKYHERSINVACSKNYCVYLGKYRIYVASNGAFELANQLGSEVTPWINTKPDTKELTWNYLNFSVTISWYAYDSVANRIASYWYDNYPEVDEATYKKFAATMYWESAIDPENVNKKTGDSWVCQRSPIRHSDFINSPWFDDYMVQAKACLDKRVAIKHNTKRANYRKAYGGSDKYIDKIIIMKDI